MNSNQPSDDLVERAMTAMLNTAGTDELPAAVLSHVRRTIAERQAVGLITRPAAGTRRERVSWLALAMTLLLMVTSAGSVGFHRRLLSEVAGQQLAANGLRYVFYSDGRVEVVEHDTD
jgi:hypothetical protein